MRKLSVVATVLACLGICGALLAGEKKIGKMKEAKMLVPGDLKWETSPDNASMSSALLWGDPKTGPYAAFNKWAAGTSVGLHTHTADVKAVMVSGTFLIATEGQPEKEISAGSYVFLPGGTRHTTVCKAGADCVYFAEQPGPGDTVLIEK